jgi:hypothetical protein
LNCESVQEKECSASEFHPSGDKRFKLLDAAMKKHQFQADALLEVLHRPRWGATAVRRGGGETRRR